MRQPTPHVGVHRVPLQTAFVDEPEAGPLHRCPRADVSVPAPAFRAMAVGDRLQLTDYLVAHGLARASSGFHRGDDTARPG